jgi:membrane protease YdiL (CAAX protease family)
MSDTDATLADRLPAPVLAVAVAVGLAALAFITGYGAGTVLGFLLRTAGVELTSRRVVVLSILTLQLVGFSIVSLGYLRYRGRTLADIGVERPSLEGWISLGAGYVAMIVLWLAGSIAVFVIGNRLGIERQQQGLIELGQQDPFIFLLMGVLSIFIVGPTEELLFRGVIQTRLRETFSPAAGVGIATTIFAFAHITDLLSGSLGGALLGVAVLLLVGLVLGVVYEYTDNLVVVAAIHGLYNLTQGLLGYVSVQFSDLEAAIVAIRAVAMVVGV